MKTYLSIILLGLTLYACHPDKNKQVTTDELRFRLTEASKLFFKNIRKSAYEVEENKAGGMDLYFSDDLRKKNLPVVPVLVISWRTDQAFFYMEKKAASDSIRFRIGKESISFTGMSQQQGVILAVQIYNALLSGEEINYLNGSDWKPYFQNTEQAQAFRIMFFDFLRLVELR